MLPDATPMVGLLREAIHRSTDELQKRTLPVVHPNYSLHSLQRIKRPRTAGTAGGWPTGKGST